MGLSDISDKVIGRFEADRLVFYHNHQPIGEMDLYSKEVRMRQGFSMDGAKIFATDDKTKLQGQYADDCGVDWCQ
ncbi:DUF2553 family protein [Laceyella putida]|uniref:DUF2553 family protein n=1 Tax=Laceyella putida TaxID=110101 RepID=A0ABW2RLR2_9BACL